MNILPCPLQASPQEISLDHDLVGKFQKAFRSQSSSIPPTVGAVALKGVFEIVTERLNADWRKLLHVNQSFDYLTPLKLPMKLRAETTLKEIKTRAQMHFLNFETKVYDQIQNQLVIVSRSTLIVRIS